MAGYFTKLNGRVYEGEYAANVDLENGTFVTINGSQKVIKSAANTNIELVCVEKTDLWGLPALRLRCEKEDGAIYMVEGDPRVYEGETFDDRHHTVKAGELVKMRAPHISDEIILAVTDELYAAANLSIDKAISAQSWRLDYRFMKLNAMLAYEKESPDMTLQQLKALVDEHYTRHPAWVFEGVEKVERRR